MYVLILLSMLAYFTWLMFRTIILYIPLNSTTGFLQLKQAYLHIDVWRTAFYTHVFSSVFALLAGFTQFSKSLMRNKPLLHRKLGYIYVTNILCVTGPAGLIMSFYANGGTISKIAFVLLSILWISFTAIALYKAKQKNFVAHRHFMIRSYALTLSALTLRSWKVILDEFTNIDSVDRYRIIAWLGWTLNLVIAELIIITLIKNRRAKNIPLPIQNR